MLCLIGRACRGAANGKVRRVGVSGKALCCVLITTWNGVREVHVHKRTSFVETPA